MSSGSIQSLLVTYSPDEYVGVDKGVENGVDLCLGNGFDG